MPITTTSIPAQNVAFYLAQALHGMEYEESERAFRRLQHGWTLDIAGDQVTVLFKDGTPFITMRAEDLMVPPPQVEYHGDSVTLTPHIPSDVLARD